MTEPTHRERILGDSFSVIDGRHRVAKFPEIDGRADDVCTESQKSDMRTAFRSWKVGEWYLFDVETACVRFNQEFLLNLIDLAPKVNLFEHVATIESKPARYVLCRHRKQRRQK